MDFNEIGQEILVQVVSTGITAAVPLAWYALGSNKSVKDYFNLKKSPVVKDDIENKINLVPNYYKVGSSPNGIARIMEFKENNVVAIGWSKLNDLSDLIGKDESEIRQVIKNKLNNTDYKELGQSYKNQIAGFFVKLLSIKKAM